MNIFSRVFGLILLLAPTVTATLRPYEGRWDQVYSNYYIQSTSEIDWKCITVDLNLTDDDNKILMSKTASLHGGPIFIRTINTTIAEVTSNVWQMGKIPFILRKTDDERSYLVLTGLDNLSLFVWARNASEFLSSQFNNQTLVDLEQWLFTGIYKTPMLCDCNRYVVSQTNQTEDTSLRRRIS